jgi:hypothetical protein
MQMTQGAFDTLSSVQPPAQPAQPAQPVTPQPASGPPDTELAYSNAAEYNRQLEAYINSQVQAGVQTAGQQFASPVLQQQKQMARQLAAQHADVAEVFRRYGNEIDTQMLQVDPQYCTVDAYVKVAKMIKGEHLDEFVADRVDAAIQARLQAGGTMSTEATPGPGESIVQKDAIDEFWESDDPYVQRCKEDNVTKTSLRNAVSAMGLAPEAYIESIKRGNMISTLGGRVVHTRNLVNVGGEKK